MELPIGIHHLLALGQATNTLLCLPCSLPHIYHLLPASHTACPFHLFSVSGQALPVSHASLLGILFKTVTTHLHLCSSFLPYFVPSLTIQLQYSQIKQRSVYCLTSPFILKCKLLKGRDCRSLL